MRPLFIAGNWKMNLSPSQGLAMVEELKSLGPVPQGVKGVIIPAFPALYPLRDALKDTEYHLGAQTMSSKDPGAYTGEVSWDMLKDVDVEYVIVGHSERRQYYNENNPAIMAKIDRALEQGISPILCVGESLEERENQRQKTKVEGQLFRVLKHLTPEQMEKTVIAYEPIWAIGTGKTATAEEAGEMGTMIRQWITDTFGEKTGETVPILYGGSVKPENIGEITAQKDIDGALVGGASLEAKSFYALLQGGKNV